MNIVQANSGLANQIYHYFFLRSLEKKTLNPFVMDNLYILSQENPDHNGFELDKVFPNIKLNCISNYLSQDIVENIIKIKKDSNNRITIPQLLNENCIPLDTIYHDASVPVYEERVIEHKTFKVQNIKIGDKNKSSIQIPVKPTGGYYVGVWNNPHFFQTVKNEMLFELQFPIITDRKNFEYLTQIKQTFSVGVHVRRGDFVNLGWDRSSKQYVPAVNLMREQINKNGKKPTFFIISDDIKWCKENVNNMGFNATDEVVFVEGNTGNGMNYIDMQFLANCKFMIRNSYSSFSKVASLLNQNLIGQIEI